VYVFEQLVWFEHNITVNCRLFLVGCGVPETGPKLPRFINSLGTSYPLAKKLSRTFEGFAGIHEGRWIFCAFFVIFSIISSSCYWYWCCLYLSDIDNSMLEALELNVSTEGMHLYFYVYKVDAQGTRHLPPPRRRTRQLLSGRGGCARGQMSASVSQQQQQWWWRCLCL